MTQVNVYLLSLRKLHSIKLKLHSIPVTPKMLKKVMESSMVFGPDFFPVMVLKKCEPELLYKLADLFI